MRIESSMVGMEAVRTYSRKETNQFSAALGGSFGSLVDDASKEEKKEAKPARMEWRDRVQVQVRTLREERGIPLAQKFRETCLDYLWECLFGEKRSFREKEIPENTMESGGFTGEMPVMKFSLNASYEETETTSFSTKGQVRCADGRTIDFNLTAVMSSTFKSEVSIKGLGEIVNAVDPLVINLKGDSAVVSDMTFYFDLDADGKEEKISALDSGSGFLALDKNEDGIINDGSELFGPKSGDGFAELRKYDLDRNGWIDENDAVFDKLKIWCKNADGKDVLYSLKEAGVGAVYLGSVGTDFTLRARGAQAAQIRQSGVFLYENGMAGTIQHVDFI